MDIKRQKINFMKPRQHFYDELKNNVAEFQRSEAYRHLNDWLSYGPIVCTGYWHIPFPLFTMVGKDGYAMNALAKPLGGREEKPKSYDAEEDSFEITIEQSQTGNFEV